MRTNMAYDIAADLDTPVSAFLKLRPLRPRFLLESVPQGDRLARYSYIGFGDCREWKLDAGGLSIDGERHRRPAGRDELLASMRDARARRASCRMTREFRSPAGWSGFPPTTWCARSSRSRPRVRTPPCRRPAISRRARCSYSIT